MVLFNNRELLKLAIISFILTILVNDLAVLLQGEIRCWSLLGFKRVKKKSDIVKCKCLDTKLKILTNILFLNLYQMIFLFKHWGTSIKLLISCQSLFVCI